MPLTIVNLNVKQLLFSFQDGYHFLCRLQLWKQELEGLQPIFKTNIFLFYTIQISFRVQSFFLHMCLKVWHFY